VLLPFNKTQKVPFFNSTSSLDDVAWAAAWMFKATGGLVLVLVLLRAGMVPASAASRDHSTSVQTE
jgi:hypothetical protein